MDKNTEIIIKIESLLEDLKQSLGTKPSVKKQGVKSSHGTSHENFSGLTKEIFNLVQEGYFKEPRTISEIAKKLHQRAVNKPTTSLMKPLRLLIHKRIIEREKPDGKGHYKYSKVNK
jgi:hypothetical protein